ATSYTTRVRWARLRPVGRRRVPRRLGRAADNAANSRIDGRWSARWELTVIYAANSPFVRRRGRIGCLRRSGPGLPPSPPTNGLPRLCLLPPLPVPAPGHLSQFRAVVPGLDLADGSRAGAHHQRVGCRV